MLLLTFEINSLDIWYQYKWLEWHRWFDLWKLELFLFGPQLPSNQKFWCRLCVVTLLVWTYRWCKRFCHRTESDLFPRPFSLSYINGSNYLFMLHFWRFLSIENLVGYFELFWRHIYINAPNTAWRYIDRSLQALQTLYWPLKFSGSKEHRFEIMTGTWRYVRRYSWRPENLLVHVALSLEFWIDFSSIFTSKM